MDKYISLNAALEAISEECKVCGPSGNCPFIMNCLIKQKRKALMAVPPAAVRPVCDINKIIDQLQEKADLYAGRAKELLEEEDGQVSQYTWAVSLRETYRRVINMLEEII